MTSSPLPEPNWRRTILAQTENLLRQISVLPIPRGIDLEEWEIRELADGLLDLAREQPERSPDAQPELIPGMSVRFISEPFTERRIVRSTSTGPEGCRIRFLEGGEMLEPDLGRITEIRSAIGKILWSAS